MTYLPILVLMLVGILLATMILILTHVVGPKLPNKTKNSPFECGFVPVGDARRRFSVRFYLVAILFMLFDVEAIFFFPWAVVYKKYLSISSFIFFEMMVFVAVLLLGYFYVLFKGALEWD